MESAVSTILMMLVVLAPAVILYHAVSSILFIPKTPKEPLTLYFRGYHQEGNQVCLLLQNYGKKDINEVVVLIFEGKSIERREASIVVVAGSTVDVCVAVPDKSGSFVVKTGEGTTLGKVEVFSLSEVLLSHGLSFGGVEKNRYDGVLFFGDHNDVYVDTGTSRPVVIKSPCLEDVECVESCKTRTTTYGSCPISFYCGGQLVGVKEMNVLQFYECNTTSECRGDVLKLDASSRGVLLVHPEGVTNVSPASGIYDANWNITIDFNGEPFLRTENPALTVSYIFNAEVTEVRMLPGSGSFWFVSGSDASSEPAYPIVFSNSFIGGQLKVGFYSVSLKNVNVQDDIPIRLTEYTYKSAEVASSESSYCIVGGDLWEIGTYAGLRDDVLSGNYCYLLIRESNNVEVNGTFISKLDGIRVLDSNNITLRSLVITSEHGLDLFDSNNIVLKDVNVFGEGPVVLSSCSGCETVLSVDLIEANSYILGNDTWVVDEGNLVVNCINCGNGFYLETNFDNNRISSGANFTVNCPYGTCCVYPG